MELIFPLHLVLLPRPIIVSNIRKNCLVYEEYYLRFEIFRQTLFRLNTCYKFLHLEMYFIS